MGGITFFKIFFVLYYPDCKIKNHFVFSNFSHPVNKSLCLIIFYTIITIGSRLGEEHIRVTFSNIRDGLYSDEKTKSS